MRCTQEKQHTNPVDSKFVWIFQTAVVPTKRKTTHTDNGNAVSDMELRAVIPQNDRPKPYYHRLVTKRPP